MEINGENVPENAAMITYLNDKYGGKIIPKEGMARFKAMKWLMLENKGLHGPYSKFMFIKRNGGEDMLAYKNTQKQ